MADLTRRQVLRNLAVGGAAAALPFEQGCEYIVAGLLGISIEQAGSLIRENLLNLAKLGHAPSVGRLAASQMTGILSDAVGGPRPGQADNFRVGSFYLLDTYGDDQVDGQVYALDADPSGLSSRGKVGLRPINTDLPGLQLEDIALSADGNLLIVSQAGDPPQWIFIDAASLGVLGRLMAPAGLYPQRCVMAPGGERGYAIATAQRSGSGQSSVQILDTSSRTIVGVIELPAGVGISDWTITPDEGLLIGVGSRYLHIMDVATRSYSGRVDVVAPLGDTQAWTGGVTSVAVHPDGEKLFSIITRVAAGQSESTAALGIFDVRSARKIGEQPLDYGPGRFDSKLAVSRDGSAVLAGFQLGPVIQVFASDTGEEIDRIEFETGYRLTGLAVV